ncbi:hypothetical protein [Isoptericola sp. BMS4]|uniref:hypothetical protein n=1 Tax=Isoptericola sp. BMS4 TaxID=2527875 RepID=UPI0014223A20|nr:hypothetical protein [Isoptericola sp. BMS4]
MMAPTEPGPALDTDGFRARQRRVLDGLTFFTGMALAGWLLPVVYLLFAAGFHTFQGGTPRTLGLAVVPWISVLLYGALVAHAAIVPLRPRRRPGTLPFDDGQVVASFGGHLVITVAGLGHSVLWAAVVLLYVGTGDAWSAVGWASVAALGVLTLVSAGRWQGDRSALVPHTWRTHPDDAFAALTDDAGSRPG